MTKEELDKLVTTEWTRLVPEGMYCEHELLLGMYWFREGVKLGATDQHDIDEVKYQKLRKLAYDMYTSMMYLSTDATNVRKATDAFYHYINFEEKAVKE